MLPRGRGNVRLLKLTKNNEINSDFGFKSDNYKL